MSIAEFLTRPDVSEILNEKNRSIEEVAQELIVLELYRGGRISGGKAAEWLGMERFEFIKYASQLGIAFIDMTPEEWARERDMAL